MTARRRQGWGASALVALVAAVVLLSVGVLTAIYQERLYRAQQVEDVREQAQILAASVSASIIFDDRRVSQERVDAMKVNRELEGVGIYDRDGTLLAGFSRVTRIPADMAKTGIAYGRGHVDVAVPVTQDGASVGTVLLRATTEPQERRGARYAGLILLVTMGALVIAVLSFSQATLTRANRALESRARELYDLNARLYAEMKERRETEEMLRQSHKMEAVGQLSGGIAHAFNNLIMVAQGNLHLFRRRLAQGTHRADRYISAAEEALDRATNLTQRVLAFSRRQPLSPKPIRLNDLIGGMGELLRHSVGEQIAIETRLDAGWWTFCDINQMENVILNLAINARDAMPGGGTLTIETADRALSAPPPGVDDFTLGDYVALTVRDTGEGMSEEVRQRALDPFFTTKPPGSGTGLGLSMTVGYVRQSNGYLTIESIPGRGAAVTLYMPSRPAPAA